MPVPASRSRSSKLDAYKEHLTARWRAHGLSAVRLLGEIRAQGFTGSLQIVRHFLHELNADSRVDQNLTVRFETAPGEQAQCDWAEIGRYPQPDGTSVRVYAFVMVLSYSRYLYVEFTRSTTLATLIRCHPNAFAFFGGWPRRILYDNMRQVVVGPERINARFLDFSRHHGFEVKRCRPYRPRTKGRAERSTPYLRDNFLDGLDDLNAQGRHRMGNVTNIRIHGTTQARPCDQLLEESLSPYAGLNPYQVARSTTCTVSLEALVRFEKSDSSVPARWLGKRVTIDAGDSVIVIHAKDLVIAEHPVATGPGSASRHPPMCASVGHARCPRPRPPRPGGATSPPPKRYRCAPLVVYAEVAL